MKRDGHRQELIWISLLLATAGSQQLSDCPGGAANGTIRQVPCPATYNSGFSNYVCLYGTWVPANDTRCACPRGSWDGGGDCVSCPNYTTTANPSATSRSQCELCAHGSMTSTGRAGDVPQCGCTQGKSYLAGTCVQCLVGTYKEEWSRPDAAANECVPCDHYRHNSLTLFRASFNKKQCICLPLGASNATTYPRICDRGAACGTNSEQTYCALCNQTFLTSMTDRDHSCRVEHVGVAAGYWRASKYSYQIFPCPVKSQCLQDGATTRCSDGARGTLCQTCESGYTLQAWLAVEMCRPCKTPMSTVQTAIGFCVTIVAILALIYVMRNRTTEAHAQYQEYKKGKRARRRLQQLQATATVRASDGQVFADFDSLRCATTRTTIDANGNYMTVDATAVTYTFNERVEAKPIEVSVQWWPAKFLKYEGHTRGKVVFDTGDTKILPLDWIRKEGHLEVMTRLSEDVLSDNSFFSNNPSVLADLHDDNDVDAELERNLQLAHANSIRSTTSSLGPTIAEAYVDRPSIRSESTNETEFGDDLASDWDSEDVWDIFLRRYKIMASFFHVVTAMKYYKAQFPITLNQVISIFNVFNLDAQDLTPLDCLADFSYYHFYVIKLATPVILAILALGVKVLIPHKAGVVFRLEIVLLFTIYPKLCSTCGETFQCFDDGNGGLWLIGDYSVSCTNDFHVAFQTIDFLFMVLYPFGIPAFFLYLLWPHVDAIKYRPIEEEMPDGLEYLGPLCLQYENGVWFWEIVECMRKYLIVSFVIVSFPKSNSFQIVFGTLICIAFNSLFLYYAPYINDVDDVLAYFCHIIILFLFILSSYTRSRQQLSLYPQFLSDRNAYEAEYFGLALLTNTASVLVLAAFFICLLTIIWHIIILIRDGTVKRQKLTYRAGDRVQVYSRDNKSGKQQYGIIMSAKRSMQYSMQVAYEIQLDNGEALSLSNSDLIAPAPYVDETISPDESESDSSLITPGVTPRGSMRGGGEGSHISWMLGSKAGLMTFGDASLREITVDRDIAAGDDDSTNPGVTRQLTVTPGGSEAGSNGEAASSEHGDDDHGIAGAGVARRSTLEFGTLEEKLRRVSTLESNGRNTLLSIDNEDDALSRTGTFRQPKQLRQISGVPEQLIRDMRLQSVMSDPTGLQYRRSKSQGAVYKLDRHGDPLTRVSSIRSRMCSDVWKAMNESDTPSHKRQEIPVGGSESMSDSAAIQRAYSVNSGLSRVNTKRSSAKQTPGKNESRSPEVKHVSKTESTRQNSQEDLGRALTE